VGDGDLWPGIRLGRYAERKLAIERQQLVLADVKAWRAWLEGNHSSSDGIWLVLAKKGTVKPTSLTYAQALEEVSLLWLDRRPGPQRRRGHVQPGLHSAP